MPYKIQAIAIIFEAVTLTVVNAIIFISWMTLFSAIPIILSSIYSINRIKRDVDKHHNGSFIEYLKYLVKKNP